MKFYQLASYYEQDQTQALGLPTNLESIATIVVLAW